jgi:cold shock CspA family protein
MKLQGTIKEIQSGRGSGIIKAADGRDFFFHQSHLDGLDFERLRAGDPVEFEFDEFRGPTTPRAMVATIVRTAGRGRGRKSQDERRTGRVDGDGSGNEKRRGNST